MFKKKKKGQVVILFVFLMIAIVTILISAALIPMGIVFTTEMYTGGEQILKIANDSIQSISDPEVKASINDALGQAFDAQENNIVVLTDMFQYSWIIVIVLVFIVIFMYTRSLVEVRTGAGGLI